VSNPGSLSAPMAATPIQENQMIDALYTLDAARRGILDLRYSRRLPMAEIAELLDLDVALVHEMLEEAVTGLVLTLEVESIDHGIALVLGLAGLPPAAWGDQTIAETVALARNELTRRGFDQLEIEATPPPVRS
jgi:hypothetical protein